MKSGLLHHFSRAYYPSPAWASIEVLLALAIIAAGLDLEIVLFRFGSAPWLVAVAALFLWWRGPGWRAIGLRRPAAPVRAAAVGVLVGVSYQFLGTYAIEPLGPPL